MAELRNITLKQPERRRRYTSVQQHQIDYDSSTELAPGKRKQQPSKESVALTPLNIYEDSGNIRSERPTSLGANVDIII